MISVFYDIGKNVLLLGIIFIFVYCIYTILYNIYLSQRLKNKIKKIRLFEPIRIVHFLVIPLIFLSIVSFLISLIIENVDEKEKLNFLQSLNPVVENVEINKIFSTVDMKEVKMKIDIEDEHVLINNEIIPTEVTILLNGKRYNKKFTSYEVAGDFVEENGQTSYDYNINCTFNFNEQDLNIGDYNVHFLSLTLYYPSNNSFKTFDLSVKQLSFKVLSTAYYKLDFKFGDKVLETYSLHKEMLFSDFVTSYENYYLINYLDQLVINEIQNFNYQYPGLLLEFKNEWEAEIIDENHIVAYPVLSGLGEIEKSIVFGFNDDTNPYRDNDLKIGIDEFLILYCGYNKKYLKRSPKILEYDSEYIECGQNSIIGKKPGITKIKVKVDLGFTTFIKEIEIEVLPYKKFLLINNEFKFLKYDYESKEIELQYNDYYNSLINIVQEYRYLTGNSIKLEDYFLVDSTIDKYKVVVPVYSTSYDKDIFRINNEGYDLLTNTLYLSEDEQIDVEINKEEMTEVEQTFYCKNSSTLGIHKVLGDTPNNYEIVIYYRVGETVYTVMKKVNVVVSTS